MGSKHRPQRSCVVCRDKMDKRSLTRLVFVDSHLRIDESGKMNGRGAYLCGKANCWDAAATRAVLDAALRRELHDDDRSYLRHMKPT
ncbi:MAG: YlxR family protein [Chloroflexota bacterium]|nr:YlxR family protein [Chloroflexota bacterium]